jgi:hypothetical protein
MTCFFLQQKYEVAYLHAYIVGVVRELIISSVTSNETELFRITKHNLIIKLIA